MRGGGGGSWLTESGVTTETLWLFPHLDTESTSCCSVGPVGNPGRSTPCPPSRQSTRTATQETGDFNRVSQHHTNWSNTSSLKPTPPIGRAPAYTAARTNHTSSYRAVLITWTGRRSRLQEISATTKTRSPALLKNEDVFLRDILNLSPPPSSPSHYYCRLVPPEWQWTAWIFDLFMWTTDGLY